MFKIFASIFIALNPFLGFLNNNAINQTITQETKQNSVQANRLPLAENIFLSAQILPINPIRNWNIADPEISAKTAIVFDTTRQMILFQKNGINDPYPIASLTKLMTALVVMDNAKMNNIFEVSKNAVNTNSEIGDLIVGEKLTVNNLLHILLMDSSNDAAVALAENISSDFVKLMNEKAKTIGLKNTFYADPSGLDPENRSSAIDLTKIMQEAIKYPKLVEIMQTSAIDFASVDGKFQHHPRNTDKLLKEITGIIGGKTGYTEEAGNCMILATKSPDQNGIIITVVIDAKDRLAETKALINWTQQAFFW